MKSPGTWAKSRPEKPGARRTNPDEEQTAQARPALCRRNQGCAPGRNLRSAGAGAGPQQAAESPPAIFQPERGRSLAAQRRWQGNGVRNPRRRQKKQVKAGHAGRFHLRYKAPVTLGRLRPNSFLEPGVIAAETQYRDWMLAGLAGDAAAYRKLLSA